MPLSWESRMVRTVRPDPVFALISPQALLSIFKSTKNARHTFDWKVFNNVSSLHSGRASLRPRCIGDGRAGV